MRLQDFCKLQKSVKKNLRKLLQVAAVIVALFLAPFSERVDSSSMSLQDAASLETLLDGSLWQAPDDLSCQGQSDCNSPIEYSFSLETDFETLIQSTRRERFILSGMASFPNSLDVRNGLAVLPSHRPPRASYFS